MVLALGAVATLIALGAWLGVAQAWWPLDAVGPARELGLTGVVLLAVAFHMREGAPPAGTRPR